MKYNRVTRKEKIVILSLYLIGSYIFEKVVTTETPKIYIIIALIITTIMLFFSLKETMITLKELRDFRAENLSNKINNDLYFARLYKIKKLKKKIKRNGRFKIKLSKIRS